MERKRISCFKEGDNLFISEGTSYIKITKDDEITCLEIPIKSSGITELIDNINKDAPKPPLANVLVEPNSEMGKQLNFTKKNWVKIPNLGDEGYIKAKEEHDNKLGMAVILKGMNVDFQDKDGNPVEDGEKKIQILKEQGMSSDQFVQLVDDIMNLTKWSDEEKRSFLEEK